MIKLPKGSELDDVENIPLGVLLIVNALGAPMDGKGHFPLKLHAIDSMIPIGRGQRELLIGRSRVAMTF